MSEQKTIDPSNEAGWFLPWHCVNTLQIASINKLIERCKHAHYTNVRVRINGQWEEFEADWIKSLVARGRP